MRQFMKLGFACALCAGVATTVSAVPAAAAGSYSPYDETASAALARYVRTLASDPKNFDALIGAGRAVLELGDAQAAAGFFARADDVNPRSPLPQIGMGAVSVANGDAGGALAYFSRAQQLGASVVQFACARGLAYDLLGQQANAQADYRLAQTGPDRDEASRRLALSQAIGGNRIAALQTLSPLMARRDPAAERTRAFVLALTGDANGAMAAINAAMPGSSSQLFPFVQRLTALGAGQKAAAVNLGIMPDSGTAYAASTQPPLPAATGLSAAVSAPSPVPAVQQQRYIPAPTQASYSTPVRRATQQAAVQTPRRIWLQLASGTNAGALPNQFVRIKRVNGELFDGIPGYVATSGDKARLVIGPFKNSSDAETFAEDLAAANIRAFEWTNSEIDRIVPVASE